MPNICILLASYNGAKYLPEQIASIRWQTRQDWHLLIRDDGSNDNTLTLLHGMAAEDPRITILDDGSGPTGNAAINFGLLMAAGLQTESRLFFFCDQDDTWDTEKLARQASEFPQAGNEQKPLLVHSDLSVVDENSREISPSLIKYMALEPEPEKPLNYLLTRNFVTGCATACNRRLLEEALPVPRDVIMHDWWLALVAAATGHIRYVPEPLAQYRQHASNTVGAKGFWHGLNPSNNWLKGWRAGNSEFLATFAQIEALCDHAEGRSSWPGCRVELLREYTRLLGRSPVKRPMAARKMNLRQGNLLLQVIYYVRLVMISQD